MLGRRRRWFVFRLILFGAVFLGAILSLQTYLFVALERLCLSITDDMEENIVIWWTPFTLETGSARSCGDVSCFFTNNRKYRNHPNFKALLFYGSKFNVSDLPLSRGDSVWALLHEESPRNTPILAHDPLLNLFNYSSTFSRYSDLPLTLQYLTSVEDLTGEEYYTSFEEKDELERASLAPVVYIQTDCVTPTNRDSYVAQLMEHIKIDSYGACLNNRKLPEDLKDSMRTMMSPAMFKFVSRYKFAIAFENGICEDYITEKLWRPLIAGVVPIYVGSPTVQDMLPNNRSVIFAKDFATPKDLAVYLSGVGGDKEAYERYREHKTKGKIDNARLLKEMADRSWTAGDLNAGPSFIDSFECLVCRVSGGGGGGGGRRVSERQYRCPPPVSIVDWRPNSSNWWHTDWALNGCSAKLLRQAIDQHMRLDETQLFQMSVRALEDGECH